MRQVQDTGVLIFSNETFEEIATRMMRSKFDSYVSESTRQAFLVDRAAVAEWTAITGAIHVCRDLLHERARLAIYDPRVPEQQIRSLAALYGDRNRGTVSTWSERETSTSIRSPAAFQAAASTML